MTTKAKPDRSTYIGSHDIAAIANVEGALYTAPNVYARKLGIEVESKQTDAMRWGNYLEYIIVVDWALQKGVDLKEIETNCQLKVEGTVCAGEEPKTYFGTDKPYIGSTPDAIWHTDQGPVVIDAKALGAYASVKKWGETDSDQLPKNLAVQGAWHCMNYPESVRALFLPLVPTSGWETREYVYERNPKLERQLYLHAQRFWENHVLARCPPDLDDSSSSRLIALNEYGSRIDEKVIAPTSEQIAWLDELDVWRTREKEAKAKAKALRHKLIAAMDGATEYEGRAKLTKNGQLRAM